MDTLKIKKLQEGLFKHTINNVDEQSFYSTTYVKLSIDNGTISINSGTFNRDFYLGRIELYDIDSITPLVVTDMDDFTKKLANLGYPLFSSAAEKGLGKEETLQSVKNLLIQINSKLNQLKATVEEFTATAGQTVFNLAGLPIGDVAISINGTRVSSSSISVSAQQITYNPVNNGGYVLEANDVVIFDF